MADKRSTLQSNEEIIEELTKNLESSCIKVDEVTPAKDKLDANLATDDVISGDNSENADETEPKITPEIDLEDEVFLKDREVNLSEVEKEELKFEAEKLKNNGNDYFKNGDYDNAILTYTQGIQTCPLAYSKIRSILYANRAAAKAKCVSQKASAISDCTKAIELDPNYVKAYVRRAQLYQEAEKLDEALEDYKKVLSFDPSHPESNDAIRRLPLKIQERNEKLKEETLSKLKDLGNMILKPFGLSTNNFELQKDPNSGGYSVKFNQNSS